MIQKSLREGSTPDSKAGGTGRGGGEGRMELREGLTLCAGDGRTQSELRDG